jgi:hypothetical protein
LRGVRQAGPSSSKPLEQLAPGREGEAQRGAAVEVQQIEGEEGRGRPARSQGGGPPVRAQPCAHALEVRVAVVADADELAVDDYPPLPERAGERAQLGECASAVAPGS